MGRERSKRPALFLIKVGARTAMQWRAPSTCLASGAAPVLKARFERTNSSVGWSTPTRRQIACSNWEAAADGAWKSSYESYLQRRY